MSDQREFSVSMCVYAGDDAAHFDAAIHSVIIQTVPPKEIVLTVDGPISGPLKDVIERYRQALAGSIIDLKIIYLAENKGHGEARRASIEQCAFDWIAIMDADDLSVPDRFEKQFALIQARPDLCVVGGYIQEFIARPEEKTGIRVVPTEDAEIRKYMKKRCPMNQVTVLFRKSAVKAVGGYIDWYCEEDYYLWIRLAMAGYRFGNLPEILVYVRVGDEMYSRRGGWKYFLSEAKLQRWMYQNRIIGFLRYIVNVCARLIVQVLMPNSMRGWFFRAFARSHRTK